VTATLIDENGEESMRKTKLHAWIAMVFCALAVGAQALTTGSFAGLF
jgi:hypothetical protein